MKVSCGERQWPGVTVGNVTEGRLLIGGFEKSLRLLCRKPWMPCRGRWILYYIQWEDFQGIEASQKYKSTYVLKDNSTGSGAVTLISMCLTFPPEIKWKQVNLTSLWYCHHGVLHSEFVLVDMQLKQRLRSWVSLVRISFLPCTKSMTVHRTSMIFSFPYWKCDYCTEIWRYNNSKSTL